MDQKEGAEFQSWEPEEFAATFPPFFSCVVPKFQSIKAFMSFDSMYVIGIKNDDNKGLKPRFYKVHGIMLDLHEWHPHILQLRYRDEIKAIIAPLCRKPCDRETIESNIIHIANKYSNLASNINKIIEQFDCDTYKINIEPSVGLNLCLTEFEHSFLQAGEEDCDVFFSGKQLVHPNRLTPTVVLYLNRILANPHAVFDLYKASPNNLLNNCRSSYYVTGSEYVSPKFLIEYLFYAEDCFGQFPTKFEEIVSTITDSPYRFDEREAALVKKIMGKYRSGTLNFLLIKLFVRLVFGVIITIGILEFLTYSNLNEVSRNIGIGFTSGIMFLHIVYSLWEYGLSRRLYDSEL